MASDPQFQQEVQQLHHHRVYTILLVGIGIMCLFTALDYLLTREHFFEFLRYRLAAVGIVSLLLTANYLDRSYTRAWIIGFCGYLAAGCVVLLTLFRMGGMTSPYYVGMIVAMTIYTALAPLTAGQTIISGFALISLYLVSISLIGEISKYEMVSLLSNLFFMICFVFIAATQSWADNSARRQEYRLRQEENKAAKKLSQQAKYLELEVKRRTAEQRATEERFRILYEAIADDVVLVTPQGDILQANQHYLDHYYGGERPAHASFLDAVRPQDRIRVERGLLSPLAQGRVVSNWRITLNSNQGHPVEVEINGALLQRAEKKIGLQLVLRDISIRQELEQKLISSLNRVQKMENATILALAKLSEYRDVTPGNHLERVREYCRLLAVELARRNEYADKLTPTFIQNIYQGAILHDIGKVAVSDEILEKNSNFTPEEVALLRLHTTKGGDVIRTMMEGIQNSGFLMVAQNIAYFHHERWDGRGYPRGLQGHKIPLEARIMSVADTYEECTTALEPDKRLSHPQAVQKIREEVGRQFDPAIVDAFLLIQDSFNRVRQTLAEPDPGLCMDSGDCLLGNK